VVGHVHTSEYEDRDGIPRSTLEMRASSVGPDLSRCIARVEKTVSTGTEAGAAPTPEPGSEAEAAGSDDADRADSAGTAPEARTGLPLSA
jgi:single-strand DNA-binding protein